MHRTLGGVVLVPKGWLEVDANVIGLTFKVNESRLYVKSSRK
jgi:hypothetical protein